MLHIEVDEARCDGFGFCEQAAPEVFGLDGDCEGGGAGAVLLPGTPDEQATTAETDVRACPVAALGVSRTPSL